MKLTGPKSAGFTFIEAILVVVILGFGLVGLMTLYSNIFTTSVVTDQTLTATYLANEKLEELIAQRELNGYASLATGTTTESPVASFPNFNRTTVVSFITPSGNSFIPSGVDVGYKQIAVTVTGFGQSRLVLTFVTNWVPL
ncbi:MAG: prepilin-type N-terminal cleavage/methylation domain-containing protein [Deltaproteobacteria bacterium]|nr:prepilin-type N-terminal cleavage/methylation domain-containing protein [Deltaproteobacteria bacterium]